jgi:hypothetical protein
VVALATVHLVDRVAAAQAVQEAKPMATAVNVEVKVAMSQAATIPLPPAEMVADICVYLRMKSL